jgi:hypothetical protein
MPAEIVVVLLALGLPAAAVRLWWIWWTSPCVDCGLTHSACVCPAGEHTMRPRR